MSWGGAFGEIYLENSKWFQPVRVGLLETLELIGNALIKHPASGTINTVV